MTPQQIDLVQSSFAKVVPITDAAAAIFYARLFEIAPRVKPLFRSDMTEQGRKLMMTLGVVVNGLKNLDAIVPAAQALAVKHVGYGVTAADYAPVGEALLWTLQQGLGEAYTAEVAAAWTTAYTTLSSVMIAAAYGEEAAA
jgi:nitric oxide dioxygenase